VTPVLRANVAVTAGSWQEAIRASCQLLLAGGAVEERYVERCVEIVHEQGPYIVVAPGIALAHARPEDGACALGLAVITLVAPVEFGHPENDPVDVVFAFSSPDREGHVALLGLLSRAIAGGLDERMRTAADATAAESALEEVVTGV
jgi:ascorbate PTS system EIIA or EIIAB component